MKLYTGECDVGDIFRADFNAFVEKFGPFPLHHYKVANAIMQCRTEHLGGFVYKCDSCDHEAILYNSCRDRHCPKCQAMARARWVQRRLKEVLPTPYFHVVFTVPHQLNPIALRNKRAFYNILFKAVSETLLKLGKDPRRLGGKVGFIAVLHTWTQKLLDHFHVHCIIPGGALNAKDNAWIPSKEKFLFPVPVMRKLFRGKFMAYFKKAVKKGEINPLNIVTPDVPSFDSLIKDLYSTDWVVYVKEPFATAKEVVKYVGRYTHRVAISNNRIIAFENGKVTFTYKDSSDKNRIKTMTLSSIEFIRRFMLHILPPGFMKIRQYGFLSNKIKKKKLKVIRTLIEAMPENTHASVTEEELIAIVPEKTVSLCPLCKKGKLKKYKEIFPVDNLYTKAVND